jgi:Zn-dependent protease with chaperone function
LRWLGWTIGLPLGLFAAWVVSFGGELKLIREDRRVLLALLFVPGLYLVLAVSVVLLLGVAGGILYLLVLLSEAIHRIPVGLMLAIALGALLGLGSVVGALWHSVRRAEVQVLAEELKRPDAPDLFAMLDRLAARLGANPPDSVVLEMGTGFFVTEAKVTTFTGTCGPRTLCLSAPLLHVLTIPEVEAILAHELAHFSGFDTAYSRRFYPIYRGASHALQGMSVAGRGTDGEGSAALIPLLLPMLLLGWYLKEFSKLEARTSREREFRADHLASDATASLVMGSALLKVHAYAPLWAGIPEGIKALYRDGKALISAAKAFGDRALGMPELVAEARTGEVHQLTHPTDSHPSLAERLRALGLERDTAPLGEGPAAVALVADLSVREERLTEALSYLVLGSSGLLKPESRTPAPPAS